MLHRRRKGRKIYTYRVKNRRVFSRYHPLRSTFGMLVTILFLVVLGIVGYSVIGPLVTRMQAESHTPTTTEHPLNLSSTDAVGTAPVLPANNTLPVTTTTTTYVSGETRALFLAADAVADLQKLEREVSNAAANGFTAVVLPVKLSGGQLQYASTVPAAQECGAVISENTLQQIASVVSGHGLIAMAAMETISDSCYPSISLEAGYVIAGTGQRWLDKAEADGGKPWMSPIATQSQAYLSSLASELVASGFRQVIYTGTAYPNFYASDLTYIGKTVSDPVQRKKGLVAMLNALGSATKYSTYAFDLYHALDGKEEALDPTMLTIGAACVTIDFHHFSTPFYHGNQRYDPSNLSMKDRTALLLEIADEMTGDMTLYPCICQDGLTESQKTSVLETVREKGYTTVFIK